MKALIAAGALAAGLTLAAPARADLDFGHGGQFGFRVGLVGGYRMVLRYDESPYCVEPDPTKTASDQQKFCGHGAPLGLDLALSFAPLDFVEPFLWARLGLAREAQTDTDAIVILGAGARLYTMSDSPFKIYVEPAVGFELEGGGADPRYAVGDYKRDLVFHLAAGPQIDFSDNIGVFADGGVTLGVRRAIHSALELKAGVQVRLP
ncbi:MAG TPA: hypothetical protein VKY73_20005 [Polyangiaceae bacterium]|nr:hypothetical protein [Polyangiaceae bacterium]